MNIKQNKNKIISDNSKIRSLKEIEDGLDSDVLAKQILIKGENRRIFNDYIFKICENTRVSSKIEEELLKTYIFSGWKLRRMRIIEKDILNKQQEALPYISFNISGEREIKKRIRNISKVEINDEIKENNIEQERLKKEMVKTLRQLREEQKFSKGINTN